MNALNQPLVKHKLGLLNLAQEQGNISQACKNHGRVARHVYRYQEAKSSGGVDALLHKDRRHPNLKNRIDQAIEDPCWPMLSNSQRMASCKHPGHHLCFLKYRCKFCAIVLPPSAMGAAIKLWIRA